MPPQSGLTFRRVRECFREIPRGLASRTRGTSQTCKYPGQCRSEYGSREDLLFRARIEVDPAWLCRRPVVPWRIAATVVPRLSWLLDRVSSFLGLMSREFPEARVRRHLQA